MASGGGDSCKAKTLEQPISDSESQLQDEEEEPTFLEQPQPRYYCLICHSVMRDPHIVMCCCKKMCGACIERVHHSGQPCPTCREPDFVMYPERDLNSEILDLKVRCTHHTNGCEWVGELRDLKKHTDPEKGGCGFIQVKCPYGCPVAYLRHESDSHESVCTNLPPELQIKRTMRATNQFKEELQVTLDQFQELYKSESKRVRELTNQLETMKENRKKEEQEMKHQFEAEKKQLLDKCRTEYQQQIKLQTENRKKEEQEMKHQFEAEKKQLLDKCRTEYQQQIKLQTENRKKEEQEMKYQFEAEKKQLLDECRTEYQQQTKLLTESLREEFTQEMSKMIKKSEEENRQMVSLQQRFEKEEKERSEAAKRQLDLAELNEPKYHRVTGEKIIEESKVFSGLSKDVLLLMSKFSEGHFKMMKFFPEEGKAVMLATSEEESEKCISQFQEAYQDIIKNRQLKSGKLEVPASFHMDDMFSLLDEFDGKYNQCHFSCDEKARVIRIVSMSSRQFDQARKLISDRLAEEKFEDKNSKEKGGGGKGGKGTPEKMSTKKGSSEVLVISKGCKLMVKRSNLVDEDVDAIVNAAFGHLKHIGGVARALDRASQGELQKASDNYVRSYGEIPVGGVAVTSAGGKLKCKRVIHAVGPSASPNTPEIICSQLIYQAINNSLYEAQRMKAASIAFPALSTGIFAVNKSLAANAIFQAILKFHYTSNDLLKDIRIVILDEETYTVFAQHLLAIKATGSSVAQATGTDSSYLITGTTNPNKSSHNHPSSEEGFSTPPTGSPPITPPPDSKKIVTGDVGCPICRNEKATDPTTTKCCQQTFCESCLRESLKHSPYCPTCKKPLKALKGNQPVGGTMTHSVLQSTSLPGYEGAGTIQITYNIPGGTQTAEHPNPGKPYHSTSHKAYLPNTREGKEILALLKKAFDAHLIFTVGTSHTTGASNSIVWNDIHHKTATHGQLFGYPDPTYLARVREELKAKGIE